VIKKKIQLRPWRIKYRLDYYKDLIKSKKGKCLSKKFIIGSNQKERWLWVQCEFKHKWKIRIAHLKKGVWCPRCAGKHSASFYYKRLKKIAKQNQGKLLSKKYINSDSKYQWQCYYEHRWWATPDSIQNGGWCSSCKLNYASETICREYLSKIFKCDFDKVYLKRIVKTEHRLELDGFSKHVKVGDNQYMDIAMEHHGRQHYDMKFTFSRSHLSDLEKEHLFKKQQERDRIKKRICEDNKIKLIIIPDLRQMLKIENLKSFIFSELERLKIPVPEDFNDIDIPLDKAIQPETIKSYNKLQNKCKRKNGICLDKIYLNNSTKMKFQCEKGHVWTSIPAVILRGGWCSTCAAIKHGGTKFRYNLDDCIQLAKEKGGKCLSTEYVTVKTSMKWQCDQGHTWQTNFDKIKNADQWCPDCSYVLRGQNYSKMMKNRKKK
jgi:hypothetical protein